MVNLGCLLRVMMQILTDFTSIAFPVVGISGIVEYVGFAIWGIHIWRLTGRPVMDGGRAAFSNLTPELERLPEATLLAGNVPA